jgi:hypothetical protein
LIILVIPSFINSSPKFAKILAIELRPCLISPHPAFGHPLPLGEGMMNFPSPSGRRCPEGADEGELTCCKT